MTYLKSGFGNSISHNYVCFFTQLFMELQSDQDAQVIETKVAAYNTRVTEVWDKLMGLELQLVDQLEVCRKIGSQ